MKINWGRIIIGIVGLLFSIYALLLISLTFFGVETEANITSYRQEYGERNETIRNQYTYVFGYEFEVNGKTYSGNGQRIGNSVFIKSDNTHKISVKFLKSCPYINCDYKAENHGLTSLIFLGIGIVLIVISRKLVSTE